MTRCPHCGEPILLGDPTPRDVREACKTAVEGTGVNWWALLQPGRKHRVVRARWRAWVTMRGQGYSYPEIGKAFGCDQSTAQYGVKKHQQEAAKA